MDSSDDSSTDSSSESLTELPAASAGILMLSLPDSFDEDGAINNGVDDKSSADQDVFETPPEYALAGTSQDKTPLLDLDQMADDGVIVAVGGCGEDGDGAVDLGIDADLVIPEAMEFRVPKRDLSLERSSAESSPPSKKWRSSDDDSEEELETEQLSLSNSDDGLEIAGNDVKSGEKSESENGTQPVTEESGRPSAGEEADYGEVDSRLSAEEEEGREWSSLLEMVKEIAAGVEEEYSEVDKCSFLEIAKRRGMTFPLLL